MRRDLTKNDLSVIRYIIKLIRSVKSNHNFLKNETSLPESVKIALSNSIYEDLAMIEPTMNEDIRSKITSNFNGSIIVWSVKNYQIFAKYINDNSNKTEALRLAADDIIENELDELLEYLEWTEEKIKEDLVETDSM